MMLVGSKQPSTRTDKQLILGVCYHILGKSFPLWSFHPSLPHANDDLSAFGSSIALGLLDRPFWFPTWQLAFHDVNSQLPNQFCLKQIFNILFACHMLPAGMLTESLQIVIRVEKRIHPYAEMLT